jgi:hypothetical protein
MEKKCIKPLKLDKEKAIVEDTKKLIRQKIIFKIKKTNR